MSEHTPDRHIDERLARLLGAPEPGDDAIASDPATRRLLAIMGEIGPDDDLEAPPAGLWDAIALGAGVVDGPQLLVADEPAGASEPAPAPGADASGAPDDLTDRRARRASSPPPWMAAAAAVLVVMVLAVGAFSIATGGDDDASTRELASAELAVLDPTWVDLGASASLVQAESEDDLVLELDVAGLEEVDGFFEVWLLTPEVDGLVSLGPLRSDGRYQVPAGLDPARFSIVDVSIEPHDGDPTHSGNSILRGGLTDA